MAGNGELGEIQLETPDQRAVRIWGGYAGYKAELDHVVRGTAESMVRIGYMLKAARDSSILDGSGYSDVWEFAEAEYGIGKSQASRFMAAADRYGDAAGRIKGEWAGRSKMELIELLSIPEEKARETPKDLPRKDLRRYIRAIKDQERSDQAGEIPEEPEDEGESTGPEVNAAPMREAEKAEQYGTGEWQQDQAAGKKTDPEEKGHEGQKDGEPLEGRVQYERSMAEYYFLSMTKLQTAMMSKIMDENVDWDSAWEKMEEADKARDQFKDAVVKMRTGDMLLRSQKKSEEEKESEKPDGSM